MKKYTITDGRQSLALDEPERLAQEGDVYELAVPFLATIAPAVYVQGDRFTIIGRTVLRHPRSLISSSLGNLNIRCKYGDSIWTCFEDLIANDRVVLIEPTLLSAYEEGVIGLPQA